MKEFFSRSWTDGEKWMMGIIAALIVALLAAAITSKSSKTVLPQEVIVKIPEKQDEKKYTDECPEGVMCVSEEGEKSKSN